MSSPFWTSEAIEHHYMLLYLYQTCMLPIIELTQYMCILEIEVPDIPIPRSALPRILKASANRLNCEALKGLGTSPDEIEVKDYHTPCEDHIGLILRGFPSSKQSYQSYSRHFKYLKR